MPLHMRPERLAVYCTTDAVNLDDFSRLADLRGLAFVHHEPRDGHPAGPAVVLDADYFWTTRDEQSRGLDELLARTVRPAVVAVHGWNLDDHADRLRGAGCLVADRLDYALVDAVAAALVRVPAPVA